MSPSSKSRSKDKKTGKEASKTSSSKSSIHVNAGAGAGVPANGYNPVLGTFHTVDTTASFSSPRVHVNGRYQTIEETDDHSSNSFGTGVECDSISNNGSWSGESEDHKEKASNQPLRQEAVPGADNDKREKIRQKNEKKHQRQKERRAQELHERCSSYLMSRKLKALSQKLVSMGFSQERATMALIDNEGRVEESVAWLLEGGEEADQTKEQNLDCGGGSLKIDISEEVARIAEMEIRCKCSRQEVERAVVACEGDLEKAEKSLRLMKEDPPSVPPKPERTDDPPVPGNGKVQVASGQNLMRTQQKAAAPTTATLQQQRNEREFNYTKLAVAAAASSVDPSNRNLQSSERIQPKVDWSKPQHNNSVPAEKRWPVTATSPASLSPALQAPPPPPPTKSESSHVPVGIELKNQQLPVSQREPLMVQGPPQSITGKMASSSTAMGWSLGNVEILKSNGFIPTVSETRTMNLGTLGTNQMYNQFPYHQQPSQAFVSSGTTVESLGTTTNRVNGLLSRTNGSPTIAAATSLGLFSGFGANFPSGSSSSLDWNSGSSVTQSDYTNIDWSLERGSSSSSMSRSNGMWPGMNGNIQYDNRTYDSFMPSRMGVNPNQNQTMRRVMSRGNSFPMGLQDGIGSSELSNSNSREWTSPFEERDIFSLPRNFVSSSSPSVEHLGEYLKKMNTK